MPSDAFQSHILADWIISDGHKRIAMLYINNAWGKGVAEEFERAYAKLGGVIVSTEACKEGDRDFRTQLTKIRDAKPSALFCPTMPQEGGIILRQLKELGIAIPVYGADAWSVDELLQGAGDAAEGVKYTYPAKFTGAEYNAFAAAFRGKFGEEPDVNAAGAYDSVKILAMCMNKVAEKGRPLTGDNIRQEMEKVEGYKGATGITTFDENGDPIAKTFEKMIIRNGKRGKYGT
jgi:branched-chain amino acid transport system substrate-binding protein